MPKSSLPTSSARLYANGEPTRYWKTMLLSLPQSHSPFPLHRYHLQSAYCRLSFGQIGVGVQDSLHAKTLQFNTKVGRQRQSSGEYWRNAAWNHYYCLDGGETDPPPLPTDFEVINNFYDHAYVYWKRSEFVSFSYFSTAMSWSNRTPLCEYDLSAVYRSLFEYI